MVVAKKQKTKLNRGRVIGCALFVATFVMAISFFGRLYRLQQRSSDLAKVRIELAELEKECAAIEEEITLLDDENYVTRYARKNWVFTKEGETVIPLPEDAASSTHAE